MLSKYQLDEINLPYQRYVLHQLLWGLHAYRMWQLLISRPSCALMPWWLTSLYHLHHMRIVRIAQLLVQVSLILDLSVAVRIHLKLHAFVRGDAFLDYLHPVCRRIDFQLVHLLVVIESDHENRVSLDALISFADGWSFFLDPQCPYQNLFWFAPK